MSKFKSSTHQRIDQRVKELLRPEIIQGATYRFRWYENEDPVERTVLSVDGSTVTYQKPSGQAKCSISTFQRLFAVHGTEIIAG
ncbi:hypothetical protein [Paenibacillus odorifer]|uniref:hypothetical protein n=1 Tax=Paenibacillus TaxID=44249 RepID=UPI00096FD1AB|nr:hypothetical protein [Paenibacillus odorifer]OMD00879.1 hypothetical protein BJP46_18800 [Paenibacillus odorifer]